MQRVPSVDHFSHAAQVENITLPWAYEPHSLFALFIMLMVIAIYSGPPVDGVFEHNINMGLLFVLLAFMLTSVVALPNGAFVRPHPALWRMVLGGSILYLHILIFVLFQSPEDINHALQFFGHKTDAVDPLDDPNYASPDACLLTWAHVSSRIDLFVVAHFFGWLVKAIMLRSSRICWFISGLWELSEVIFSQMLPNFAECWWDQLGLDFLICNGLGIVVGGWLCGIFDLREYRWEGILRLPRKRDKIKRAFLQFTPASWTVVEWDPLESPRRFLMVLVLIYGCLLVELNTFLLKHIFRVPSSDSINFWRLVLWTLWGAPGLRQFYFFCSDRSCKKLGTQAWVLAALIAMEQLVCLKFGGCVFESRSTAQAVATWLVAVTMLAMAAGAVSLMVNRKAKLRSPRTQRKLVKEEKEE